MARSSKTVSIRHLHAAVKSALETTKKDHPSMKFETGAPVGVLPIYIRYPWICGIPPFPFREAELPAIAAATKDFATALASDKQIAALGLDGKFEPALHVTGSSVAIGIVPADVSFTE
jgi:hypothetical protein